MATTKLGLNTPAFGAAVGTWDTLWAADSNAVENYLATTYAGNPNSNVAGQYEGQKCFDTTNDKWYVCTTTGNAATAVWTEDQRLSDFWDVSTTQDYSNTFTVGNGQGNACLFTDSATHEGGYHNVIVGGTSNKIYAADTTTPFEAFIGGGEGCQISEGYTNAIVGGTVCEIHAASGYSFIGGGYGAIIGQYGVDTSGEGNGIIAGWSNEIGDDCLYNFIGAGYINVIAANVEGAAAVGCHRGDINADYTLSSGYRPYVTHAGTRNLGGHSDANSVQGAIDAVFYATTTDAGTAVMTLAGSGDDLALDTYSLYAIDITIIGKKRGSTNSAVFRRTVDLYQGANAAATALLGSVITIGTDNNSVAYGTPAIVANTTGGYPQITVQGKAAEGAVDWSAYAHIVRVIAA